MMTQHKRRSCLYKIYQLTSIYALIVALNGCSMAPDYIQPSLPTAEQYPNLVDQSLSKSSELKQAASQISWQKFYHHAELRGLIQTALKHNRDLRKAILNIEQAQLLYNVQRNELLPTINATAGYTRQRTGKEVTIPGLPVLTKEYQVGIGITAFELDLFGRIESLDEAALATYLAMTETARAAQIALIAAVAHAYINERSLSAQLEIAKTVVDSGRQANKLAQQQYDAGNTALDSLKIQQRRLYQYQIQAAELTRLHAQAYNTLVMLVGKPTLNKLKTPFIQTINVNTKSFASLPSDLLLHRPDIMAAEQQLKAANAHIGVARAAFFPRISLTTLVGTASPQLSHLFKHDNRSWSFMPSLSLPIFDWGTNKTNLDLAEIRKKIEIAAYESSIQTAFKEVADALMVRAAYDQQCQDQQGLIDTITVQKQLIEQKYQHGMVSNLEVLSILQDLYQSQQAFIQFQQAQMDNAIDLYKALGGGLT